MVACRVCCVACRLQACTAAGGRWALCGGGERAGVRPVVAAGRAVASGRRSPVDPITNEGKGALENMKRIRIMGLCLVAAFAFSALVVYGGAGS